MPLSNTNPALFALQAFGLAVIASFISRYYVKNETTIKNANEIIATIIVHLFLPLLVFEALTNNIQNIKNYITLYFIGFLISLTLYLTTLVFSRKLKPEFKHLNLLVSTFGGGNRGVALMSLIIIAAPSLYSTNIDHDYDEMLSSFIMLDLGNFTFFLTYLPTLICKEAGLVPTKKLSGMTDMLTIFGPYTLAVLMPILLFFTYSIGNDWASQVLSHSKECRKFTLLFLSTYYIFLQFDFKLKTIFKSAFLCTLFIVFRLMAISLIFLYFHIMYEREIFSIFDMILNSNIALPIIILLCCPPSSLLPALLNQAGLSQNETKIVDNSTGVLAFLFYIMLLFLGVFFASAQ